MLCTSCLADDVTFSQNGPYAKEIYTGWAKKLLTHIFYSGGVNNNKCVINTGFTNVLK